MTVAGGASRVPGLTRRAGLAALLAGMLPAARAAERFDRGLLWRLGRPGVAPSHLYGTVHLDAPALLDFAAPVRAALSAARVLVLELQDDPQSALQFEQAARLDGALTLRGLLGEAAFAQVAALLTSRYAMPPRVADRLKPWAAFLALGQPPRRQGEVVDSALKRLALAQGLALAPLERIEDQIAALDAVPLASQLALLELIARRHDAALAAAEALVPLYLAEDLAGMRRLDRALADTAPARAALDALHSQLLHRRNARMVEGMLPQLREGRAFVAMGALHLHGRDGLPARLRRLGWTARRIPLNGRD